MPVGCIPASDSYSPAGVVHAPGGPLHGNRLILRADAGLATGYPSLRARRGANHPAGLALSGVETERRADARVGGRGGRRHFPTVEGNPDARADAAVVGLADEPNMLAGPQVAALAEVRAAAGERAAGGRVALDRVGARAGE